MKVLVACEESQRVCTAFRELGHEAYRTRHLADSNFGESGSDTEHCSRLGQTMQPS